MCYSIPGKITHIEGNKVTIDYFGEEKTAVNELEGLKLGDYIYAQGGFVIDHISEQQALEVLKEWKEIFFHLKQIDDKNSQFNPYEDKATKRTTIIFEKAMKGLIPTKNELKYLLDLSKPEDLETLFKAANYIRHSHQGNSCCVHGIIEISNSCVKNCTYCGISTNNKNINRYRMSREEILEAVGEAVTKFGFKALVLQSGENCGYTVDELAEIIKEIRTKFPVLIFISFGQLGTSGLEKLYKAGARGLLLRFETSNPEIYEKLHPGTNAVSGTKDALQSRVDEIKHAKSLGYLIITGGLIGLPGQTTDDLVNDILLTHELGTDMFSYGPFLPHPETPMAEIPKPVVNDILKVIAVSRYVAEKNSNVVITTGLETLDSSARKEGLMSGGSSVMINITPLKYRTLYSIYPNRAHEKESIETQIQETIDLLKSIGRSPTDLNYRKE